jgi:hypothetical protein
MKKSALVDAYNHVSLGYFGCVSLIAFALLTLCAWFGMTLAARWVRRFLDRLHAWAYVGVLRVVLVSLGSA